LFKFSFPMVGLKMSSLPTLPIKSPDKIFMLYREFIETSLYIISFIFCWSMNVQNNGMTPATS
jgi:hypothetical protein